jgi:hypothetical protein
VPGSAIIIPAPLDSTSPLKEGRAIKRGFAKTIGLRSSGIFKRATGARLKGVFPKVTGVPLAGPFTRFTALPLTGAHMKRIGAALKGSCIKVTGLTITASSATGLGGIDLATAGFVSLGVLGASIGRGIGSWLT